MFAGKDIPIIGFAGSSNSGKTTLVEKLISIFRNKGLRVTVIKHTHHDVGFDESGKDTYRHKKAGAAAVILASPVGLAVTKDTPEELSLEEIVSHYVDDADLILVEGFKRAAIPKIEVYTRESGESSLCLTGDNSYIAVATDDDLDVSIPIFRRDDADAIAGFLSDHILRR